MPELPERAVLLLSGGMDSTTLLWWMKDRGVQDIHTAVGSEVPLEPHSEGRRERLFFLLNGKWV